jgi:hypothetical protein
MLDIVIFDKIINHKDVNKDIIANTYLHVVNSANFDLLENYNISKIKKIWMLIRANLIFIIKALHSIFDNQHYYTRQKNIKSDVLFVSHLTNQQQISQDNDAYFGDLPDQLLENGVSSSVILINHAKATKKQVLDGWVDNKVHRIILSSSLNLFLEIESYFSQLKSKKKLRFILNDLKVEKQIAKDILRNHLSSGTFNALRVAKQVVDIARKTEAKFVVTTYEGHAWERLVYYYAKKNNLIIKCFGYQHASVSEHQHAIKRPLSKEYNPDIILTSGLISQTIFGKIEKIESSVLCLGSPKYSISRAISIKSDCCLVATQGDVVECLALFEFSLVYAQQHQKQRFIWRVHPIIDFAQLQKHSDIFDNLPDNIYLSKDSLEEDIQKCDSILYRGTTVVVNAINAGLKPIYYQKCIGELSVDPIYTQHLGKFVVSNRRELNFALEKRVDLEARQNLQRFAQNFYTPLDVRILLNELIY